MSTGLHEDPDRGMFLESPGAVPWHFWYHPL